MPNETQPPSQYGSVDNVINYCEYEVSLIRKPSVEETHEDIDYFAGVLQNVISFEVRESIDQFYRTGVVTLSDRSSLRDILPLTGNEIITIAYKNTMHSAVSSLKRKIVHFKIFHIEEYENTQDRSARNGGSYINLHLVEWPIFEFLSTSVYKTFPTSHTPDGGVKASTLIETLLKSIKGFENYYDISVDPTPDDFKFHNFYIPNWTITKSLQYISQFLVNKDNYPYYVFGIRSSPEGLGHKPLAYYSSIFSFFDTPHYRLYSTTKPDTLLNKPSPSNVGGSDENSRNTIPKPEEDDNYHPLDYIQNRDIEFGNMNRYFQGLLAGRTVLNYDYNEGNSYTALDYRNFMKTYKTLGLTMPIPLDYNGYGNQWKNYDTVAYNNQDMAKGYVSNKMARGTFKEMFFNASCPVNETRMLAEKAALLLPTPIKDRAIDYQMSGRWMTYAIVDIVTASGFATSQVTFARDSFWLTDGDYLERSPNTWEDDITELR